MIEQFEKIYKNKEWGKSRLYPKHGGSGMGSSVEYLRGLISVLQEYILERKISSFLDIGCGECEWQRTINWEQLNCKYIGIELLPDLVKRVSSDLAGRKNMTLIQGDCLQMSLPKTDVVFIKEVFQHWPIHLTNNLLEKLCTTSTNCLTYNCDASSSFFRYNTYKYFISKELEIHDEVVDEIAEKLCKISWDTFVGGFRPCNFDSYGNRLTIFKWKWHFPASLISIQRIAREHEVESILFNSDNIYRQIDLFTGGIYKDADIFYG